MKKHEKQKTALFSPTRFAKIRRWTLVALVYVAAFYLGNLTGEYAAARMPIVSFHMPQFPSFTLPSFTLPKVSIRWNSSKFSSVLQQTSPSEPSNTKVVVIGGNFINMPLAGATQTEQEKFAQAVQKLAVVSGSIAVSSACELQPAFVRTKSGSLLKFTTTSTQPHSITLNTQNAQTLDSSGEVSVTMSDPKGIYPISCDGVIAGFYIVG